MSFPATTSIGKAVFSGCTELTSFALTGTGALSVIEGGKALVRNNTELVAYPSAAGSITLNTITSIDGGAFSGCSGLTSVSLPAATNIGNGAFNGCTGLADVSLPKAASIGSQAFDGCTGLTSASFPKATSIGEYAFADTGTAALSITLGSTAPKVGKEMFGFVYDVKAVTVRYPVNASGYGTAPTDTSADNWGNAFRGKGWDGNSYDSGVVNGSISLTY